MKNAVEKLKHLGVEHCGSVSAKQMIKEQNEASVFPFSCDTVAFSEGFSLSCMQAHASYTVPVIAKTDCLGSVYKDSGAILVDTPMKDHLEEFYAAMIKSLTDKEFADRVIDKCRVFAHRYNWKNIIAKLETEIAKGK
jgi:glycosyltransferase involved in cell wall biosynthesis